MNKQLLQLAGICGASAVIIGAFAAHGLKSRISPEQIQIFETGVRYHFYHSLAILVLAAIAINSNVQVKTSAYLFSLGIFLFSGSLYLLSCRDLLGIQNWKFLGPITPIGGLCFVLAWILLVFKALK